MLGERQQALLPGGGVSKPVATAAVLNLMIAVVEAAAGVRSGSVSLLVDSVHNLSDEMALILLFLAFIPPAGLSRNLRIFEGRKEVHVKTTRIMAVAALIVASALAPHVALAQAPGIKRTDLQRHDLSVPGREVIQVLVEFAPGVVAPNHSHPGEEIVYVVEGLLEYALEGRPPVTLKAGDVLFIPAGTPHAVTNVGSGNAAELATYIVEKGKPLLTLVK
jgi:quercetin dioxygenase-like cupin family protein